MYIYHGTKNKFKEFDFSRIRENATQEGVGFYCTDNKEVAERYGHNGYVNTYKFVGTKQLSSNEVTLTENMLKKYLLALHEEGSYLDNYGDVSWEGVDRVLNNAVYNSLEYATDDIEIISGICNAYGEFEEPLVKLYELFGFDHSIVNAEWGNQKIYLILNQSAIQFIEREEN